MSATTNLQKSLPPLPPRSDNQPYHPNVYKSVQIASDIYKRAFNLLASGNFDLHRLKHHIDAVVENALPMLVLLDDVRNDHQVSYEWPHTCAALLLQLYGELLAARKSASDG